MHASRLTPEPGTFRHVLTRFDWNPDMEVTEANYGEIRKSRCIPWPEGMALPKRRPDMDRWRPADGGTGREPVMMMFVVDRHLRTRMIKLGWLDITDAWMEHHAAEQAEADDLRGPPPVIRDGLSGAIAPRSGPVAGART